jgi:hypothetical protein
MYLYTIIVGMPMIQYANHITNNTYRTIKGKEINTKLNTFVTPPGGVENIFKECLISLPSSNVPSMIEKGEHEFLASSLYNIICLTATL